MIDEQRVRIVGAFGVNRSRGLWISIIQPDLVLGAWLQVGNADPHQGFAEQRIPFLHVVLERPIFRISDGPVSPELGQIRRNTVSFKGTEVYVAVGSTVRYAELREWFAMDEETQDRAHYQVLFMFVRGS